MTTQKRFAEMEAEVLRDCPAPVLVFGVNDRRLNERHFPDGVRLMYSAHPYTLAASEFIKRVDTVFVGGNNRFFLTPTDAVNDAFNNKARSNFSCLRSLEAQRRDRISDTKGK